MDSNLEATCREWCKSHYWQLQERHGWRYAFHESVMVRYYEEANLDATLLEPLVEFLKGDGWQDSFTVHNKPVDMSGWKTRDVWYETRDGDTKETTKLKRTRIYHAVYKEGANGAGDGPYMVENGCKWKVSHVFHWKVAALPEVPQGESGVQWRLQGVARDDETGLWSCVLERRETVRQDVPEYGTAATMFEHRTEEQHLGVKQGQVASTGKEASAGGGTMVRRQVRKNEDCTSDVTNETIEERPVAVAVEETTKTARGTRTVTVNRNQADKAELGSAQGVRNERTEGGLWNQTITTFARILGRFRATCRKTVFLHEHAETVTVDNDPGFQHVESAGGGVVSEKTVTRNEEGGFDVDTRTRQEQSVPGAVVETQKFVDGVTVTTVNRGQAAAASASGLRIGERVRNEKTEGGLVDQTIVQASVEPVGRTGAACEQNALVHTHSETQGMGTQAQQAEVEAADGQIKARRVRLTERGAWEVTDETRTAKEAQAQAQGGSVGRQLTVESKRNVADLGVPPPGTNEEVDVTVQRNEFGLLDGTIRKTTYSEKAATGGGGTEGTTVTTETHRDAPSAPAAEQGGVNKVVETSVTPNDHGSYDYTKRTTEYTEKSATATGGSYMTNETRTVTENGTESAPSENPQRGTTWDVTAQPNDHGSYRVTKTRRTAVADSQSTTWQDKVDNGDTVTTYNCAVFVYRNQPSVPEAPNYQSVQCSLSINEFGLYDVVYHCRSFVSKVASSHGGGSGEQGDHTSQVTQKQKVKKNGKLYERTVTATRRILWSTRANMLAEVAAGQSRPDLGWVSKLCGWYAVIYTNIQEGSDWTVVNVGGSNGS